MEPDSILIICTPCKLLKHETTGQTVFTVYELLLGALSQQSFQLSVLLRVMRNNS